METSSREEWRRVAAFPNYFVSNRGRLRHNRRILKGSYSAITGHYTITLSNGEYSAGRYIARLILEAFVGPCPHKQYAQFLDGNTRNLTLSNLYWGSKIQYTRPRTTKADIQKVVKMLNDGMARKEIAIALDITYSQVVYRLRRARQAGSTAQPG